MEVLNTWEKWQFGRKKKVQAHKSLPIYRDCITITKCLGIMLIFYKKKKDHTSIKYVAYPKQLLPLSYISRPYWRTSDTLLTSRSINNYCSLWDAERGFREFIGKRHNLLVAVKQLQYIPSLHHHHPFHTHTFFILVGLSRDLLSSCPHCGAHMCSLWVLSAPHNNNHGTSRDFVCFLSDTPQQLLFTIIIASSTCNDFFIIFLINKTRRPIVKYHILVKV